MHCTAIELKLCVALLTSSRGVESEVNFWLLEQSFDEIEGEVVC